MSIYDSAEEVYRKHGAHEGAEGALPPIQVPHFPIFDTALAACLATLSVPFRNHDPFTDDINANTDQRRRCFWMGNVSEDGTSHQTEFIMGAWARREAFEKDHPLHPLVAMRAALDARRWWLAKMRERRVDVPRGTNGVFGTDHLAKAALLKASGFQALEFNGHSFILAALCQGVPAAQVLAISQCSEGASPPQWMWKALCNFSHLLTIAKSRAPIIRHTVDTQTVILRADASAELKDKFYNLL